MIKVEYISTCNFAAAIRGMRNPLNSWDKSDSHGDTVGAADMDLMRRLFAGGSEHRKYLRQMFVSMDITAPLYWWSQYDTYKVGTVANSCSKMHKIHDKDFTLEDFSCEHLIDEMNGWIKDADGNLWCSAFTHMETTINTLNAYRYQYIRTKDKKYWWQMIQLLPSSYNQRRTVTMNYENVVNIIHQRRNHKLDEWREFVEILLGLPYVKDILNE